MSPDNPVPEDPRCGESSGCGPSHPQTGHKLCQLQPGHFLETLPGACSTSRSPPGQRKGVALLTPQCRFQTLTLPLPVRVSAPPRLGQVVRSASHVPEDRQLPLPHTHHLVRHDVQSLPSTGASRPTGLLRPEAGMSTARRAPIRSSSELPLGRNLRLQQPSPTQQATPCAGLPCAPCSWAPGPRAPRAPRAPGPRLHFLPAQPGPHSCHLNYSLPASAFNLIFLGKCNPNEVHDPCSLTLCPGCECR